MQATALTLATGQRIEVKGSYEDVSLTLKPRNLSETGTREFTKANGKKFTVAIGAVVLTEELDEIQTGSGCKLGFVKD